MKKYNNSLNYLQNYKEAFRFLNLSLSLENENKNGHFYIGYLYENGLGTIKNAYLAYNHYNLAMSQGNIKAKTKVALCLYNGIDGFLQPNTKMATELLDEAASLDEPDALNYLGLIHESKLPLKSSAINKTSAFLYQRSIARGNSDALLNLASLKLKEKDLLEGNENKDFMNVLTQTARKGNGVAKFLYETIYLSKENSNNEESKSKKNL